MPFNLDRFAKRASRQARRLAKDANSSLQHALHKKHKKKRKSDPMKPVKVNFGEEAASMLEDLIHSGATVRFRSVQTGRYLRIMPNGFIVNSSGGNGKLPYFKLSGESRYKAHLCSNHTKNFLKLPDSGAKPCGVSEAEPIYIDANDDGTVCLVTVNGLYCIDVLPQGGVRTCKKEPKTSTKFILMIGDSAVKLDDDDDEGSPDFLAGFDSDAESEFEDDKEEFEAILSMEGEDRVERVKELSPENRHHFHDYRAFCLKKKLKAKETRHQAREQKGVEIDEDKYAADVQEITEAIKKVSLLGIAQDDEEPFFDFESSDEEVDEEALRQQQEEEERLAAEAAAEAMAQLEEERKLAQQRQAEAEAKLAAMQEQQLKIQQEAEERIAAALAAAKQQAQEAEPSESEDESGSEADDDSDASEDYDSEDDEAEEMNEDSTQPGAIETRTEIPEPKAAVFDKADFDAEAVAKNLKKAFKGFGCDKKAVYTNIMSISNKQRQQVKEKYKMMYGKSLEHDVRGELGYHVHLRQLMLAALATPDAYSAECLHNAFRSSSTLTMVEVICTRSNEELARIQEAYKALYKREVEEDVKAHASGEFARLLISRLAGGQNTNDEVDLEKAKAEAGLLKDNIKRYVQDESALLQVLAVRSPAQLRATTAAFQEMTGKDITKQIKKYLKPKVAAAYIAIIACARNPARYFAEQLCQAFKGLGMDENKVIRIFVSRSEYDLASITELYPEIGKVSLKEAIKSECSSTLRKALDILGHLN